MVAKRTQDKTLEVFELQLTHADIIDMMNDPDVLLDDGNVSSTQELEIVSRRLNGAETVFAKFGPNDTLVLRFRRCTIGETVVPLNDVDVT